jgi:hypothetical protein
VRLILGLREVVWSSQTDFHFAPRCREHGSGQAYRSGIRLPTLFARSADIRVSCAGPIVTRGDVFGFAELTFVFVGLVLVSTVDAFVLTRSAFGITGKALHTVHLWI